MCLFAGEGVAKDDEDDEGMGLKILDGEDVVAGVGVPMAADTVLLGVVPDRTDGELSEIQDDCGCCCCCCGTPEESTESSNLGDEPENCTLLPTKRTPTGSELMD